MRRWLFLFLLASPLAAASVVVCDPADPTVADRVVLYRTSVNTPEYDSNPDALINPDVSTVLGIEPLRYWKCDRPGVAAVPMSAGEKAAVDAADAAAFDAAVRAGATGNIQGFNDISLLHRAVADILKDEINILRQWTVSLKAETAGANNFSSFKSGVDTLPTLSDRTWAQIRTAIENRVNDGTVDAD